MTKLFLCGYHVPGVEVLRHIVSRPDVSELAVFTHEPGAGTPSVIEAAQSLGVRVTTKSVNETGAWPFEPDVISSVYYRNIFSAEAIERVGGAAFNVHPALLPRHRGCSSLTWALFEGDQYAGITYHYMVPKVDAGRILLQQAIEITPDDTQATLYQRAMEYAAAYWPAAFELVVSGFKGVEQVGTGSYHTRGVPNQGEIDANWDLAKVDRFIRAMTHPPFPYAKFQGHEVRSIDEYVALKEAGQRPKCGV